MMDADKTFGCLEPHSTIKRAPKLPLTVALNGYDFEKWWIFQLHISPKNVSFDLKLQLNLVYTQFC